MAEPRIVSLIASATEIVASLGFADRLVGRSHECDFPREVLELPVCSEPKIDVEGTSREIDQRVKSLAGDAISVYRVFPDVLNRLAPTHIITQTQCEVCAVSLKDVEAAIGQMVESRPNIIALSPMCLDDLWADIRIVARALSAEDQGEQVVKTRQSELNTLAAELANIGKRPTIACVEWIDPLMAAGNWVPELVDIAGGRNLLGRVGEHSPWMEQSDLTTSDPDVIVVMPCGFDIPRTRREMSALTSNPQWAGLRAVREGSVYLTDGNQYFNRPGPRLVESARILAEILHPKLFPPSFEAKGWERLADVRL